MTCRTARITRCVAVIAVTSFVVRDGVGAELMAAGWVTWFGPAAPTVVLADMQL